MFLLADYRNSTWLKTQEKFEFLSLQDGSQQKFVVYVNDLQIQNQKKFF